ncbi:hypothetical protein Tco_1285584, partial [Tanacetum coccineum]
MVLRTIQLPVTLDGELFCDPKFFESRGCLLLVCKADPDSRQLYIFDMRNGYSEWSPKYLINLDDIMTPLPQNWGIYSSVWCIVLGEREEDSFMVIESNEKVLNVKVEALEESDVPSMEFCFYQCVSDCVHDEQRTFIGS